MNKTVIAGLLLGKDHRDALPFSLNINNESVEFNLRKTPGIVFLGANAASTMRTVVAQLNRSRPGVIEIGTPEDLAELYALFVLAYARWLVFSPPRAVIFPNIDALCRNSSENCRRLSEILNKCRGLQLHAIAHAKKEVPRELKYAFSVRLEQFASPEADGTNAALEFRGNKQRIKLQLPG